MKRSPEGWALRLTVVVLCLAACADEPPTLDVVGAGEAPDVVVSYLAEPIPPCTPLEGSDQDPCPTSRPGSVAVLSAPSSPPSWPYTNRIPTIAEIVTGPDPGTANHIAVRATVVDDSTRCELYPIVFGDYVDFVEGDLHHYLCFVDLRVNEYIVGTGPARLTTILHGEVLLLSDAEVADWVNWRDDWLANTVRDPRSRTANAYEGKEIVVFLGPSLTIAVEAWDGGSSIADVWFVQRPEGGPVRAVAPDVVLAETDEQRAKLDMPLADLVAQIRAAATDRAARFRGRIGEDTDLPMLVTDANYLRRYYEDVGAVYQGEDKTTVLPPAVGS